MNQTKLEKRIEVYKDGDMWCVLWGENLQDGICGFGIDVNEAWEEFVKDFAKGFLNLHKWFQPKVIVEMFNNLMDINEELLEKEFKDTRDAIFDEYYKLKGKKWLL